MKTLLSLPPCILALILGFGATVSTEAAKNAATQKLLQLEEKSFEEASVTNQIDPVWLKPSTNLYQLGPGDVIEIESLSDVANPVTVSLGPDGKIYYSLLPGLSVWGLTLTETKQTLEKAMEKFFRTTPEVAVNLKAVRSKNVWILGTVQNPGLYSLQTPLTILEAITTAGGALNLPGSPDGVCDLQRSFVMRDGQPLTIDFERLLRFGDMTQNVYLMPNDLVYLRSAQIRNVCVLGAVAGPRIVPFTDKISLASAVMNCGGTIDYAYKSSVAVIRGSLTNPKVAKVDLGQILKGKSRDVLLKPGDIVYVPFAPWRKPATFLDNVARNFVRTVSLNEGYRAVSDRLGAGGLPPTTSPSGISAPTFNSFPTFNRGY